MTRSCRRAGAAFVWMFVGSLAVACYAAETVPLATLDLSKMSAGWGQPVANRSIQDQPLSIASRKFEHGVGTHAPSAMWIDLKGGATRFTAWVGVDDEVGTSRGSVEFRVVADDEILWRSGIMKTGDAAKHVDVDLTGKKTLVLVVRNAGDGKDYDHANWAEAEFQVTGDAPVAVDLPQVPEEPLVILTPKPGPGPKINGPRLFGERPGRPFIYRIPCTGTRPIQFAVKGLPPGLELDPASGIIRGRVPQQAGDYETTLMATNAAGVCEKPLTIVVGETLALTPPMGWNSWYIHYLRVTEQHMRSAADVMISSGMADNGYMYVNIDDCWMKRNERRAVSRCGGCRAAERQVPGHQRDDRSHPRQGVARRYLYFPWAVDLRRIRGLV